MKQITTTVYNFSELSDKAKEKARQWWRDSFEFDASSILDDAKAIGKFLGYDISKIYYSGFSSQGDGACFEGAWNGILDLDGLKAYMSKDEELQKIGAALAREVAAFPTASLTVKHHGRYYHDKSTVFDIDCGNGIYSQSADDCAKQLIDLSRDFMRWIYRQLEQEYNYQNSDEAVDENINANEYTFTEDGKRFGN
jgi:hypothetical protein